MIGLLGIVGVMMAGAAADAVMTRVRPEDLAEEETEEVSDKDEVEEDGTPRGDFLDMLPGRDDGMPHSGDLPDPVEAPVSETGGEGGDVLAGAGGADTLSGGG